MSQPTDPAPPSPAHATAASRPAQKPPRLALLIATGFGLGYLPKAPGTWGSLVGALLCWACYGPPDPRNLLGLTREWMLVDQAFSVLIAAMVGVWAAGKSAKTLGQHDPQIVVVDEVSGQILTYAGIWPLSWQYLLAGFILFRVFDIWKPWPVRAAEKLPGGWGIMADDWVAGIYAALCLWGLRAAGM